MDMQWLQQAMNLANMPQFNTQKPNNNNNDANQQQEYQYDEDGAYAVDEEYEQASEVITQHDLTEEQDQYQPDNPMIPGLSRTPSMIVAPKRPEKEDDPAQRAATLRAKLLSMKSNAGTPNKARSPAAVADQATAPDADVDAFIAEGRAAAESNQPIAAVINEVSGNSAHRNNANMADVTTGAEQDGQAGVVGESCSDRHNTKLAVDGTRDEDTQQSPRDQDIGKQLQLFDEGERHGERRKNAAAYSHYFDDLDEWLDITGYHNRSIRERYLQRHRALADLELQRAAIEAEFDAADLPPVLLAREVQPSANAERNRDVPGLQNDLMTASLAVNGSVTRHEQQNKRPPPVDATISGPRPGKFQRTIPPPTAPKAAEMSFSRGRLVSNTTETAMPPPAKPQGSAQRALSLEPGPNRSFPRHSQIASNRWYANNGNSSSPGRAPDAKDSSSAYRAGHSSHEDRRSISDRYDYDRRRAQTVAPRPPVMPAKRSTRYFMIKSWNYENVEISQQEGTWATQLSNEDTFREAYTTARSVILVFSVNKSTAFQGYARMESLPGTAPEPPWVKKLLWPCSPPFYIRWITIAETHFRKVGHLKNPLNEGQAVLIGRDGQEIEEYCGKALCELIDEQKMSFSRPY